MKKVKGLIKLFLISLAAVICLCSCAEIRDAASSVVSDVLDSAANEISDAISEGMDEITDGIDDIRKEITENSEDLKEIKESVSRSVESLADDIHESIDSGIAKGSEILSSLNEAAITIAGTTASSDDTTTEPQKSYQFRSRKLYDQHYEKHGKEFGSITKEEYLSMANELINSASESVLHKISKDGDYLYFDQDTGYFLVLSDDGYIRTFFIPDKGKAYYDKQ